MKPFTPICFMSRLAITAVVLASTGLPLPWLIAFADTNSTDAESWFAQEAPAAIPQVGEGELVFLSESPPGGVLHSQNRITLSTASLATGWVAIMQCYRGLDEMRTTEIVYRYRNMRDLRIVSSSNMRAARVQGNSVQLHDVGADASLCIQAEAQILYPRADRHWALRNGPFHRRFLDGYFPLRVTLEVTFPAQSISVAGTAPQQQPGFEVTTGAGHVLIDSLFAGSLTVEIFFTPRDPP